MQVGQAKPPSLKPQASSLKPQASSLKPQASSRVDGFFLAQHIGPARPVSF